MTARYGLPGLLVALAPAWAVAAAEEVHCSGWQPGNAGISGLWVLANVSYAGMRAQDHPSRGWRVLSFIFGFPGTLVTFFAVNEGSQRAYGVDLPRRP